MFGTHNGRGWLLHFDATLATRYTPGGFGWDDTAVGGAGVARAVVHRQLAVPVDGQVQQLPRRRPGDGANRVAIIDPRADQVDPISGLPIMREVLTLLGPTFESGTSGPVVEWCINTAAVDPFTRSVLVNSEDGYLYRWDLVDQHREPADPAHQRHRRVVHADRDRRRRRGLRGQQRGAVLDREVARRLRTGSARRRRRTRRGSGC